MKQRTTIILTILITLSVVVAGYFLFQYEQGKINDAYQKGYDNGNLDGSLYTQRSGNVVLVNETGHLIEKSIGQICGELYG